MQLTIGLAQTYPVLGDLDANLAAHLDWIAQARARGVDLLVFPEMSLTGYQVQDLAPEVALKASADEPVIAALLDASRDIDLVIGFVHADARQRFYIASAYLTGGTIRHIHHKLYLPTYTLFDEGRFFAEGNTARAFDTRFGRVGMLICEDFWHMSPPYLLWLDGADLLILHSASPGRGLDRGEQLAAARWVERVNQTYGSMLTSYVVHTNRVGYEDGIVFWGGSSVVDTNGEFMLHTPYFEEGLYTQTIDLNQIRRTRARLPLLRDEKAELVRRELDRILHNDSA
jgi:NAD+ synthase (glutamine-hydrolysing)